MSDVGSMDEPGPCVVPVFYKIDSSRGTLREWCWGNSPLLMPLICLIKVLRIRLPITVEDVNVESLRPFKVEESEPPAVVGWLHEMGCVDVRYEFTATLEWEDDDLRAEW